MYTHEYRLIQFRLLLSGPAQDLSLFILQFIIRTCTCRPGIVSQYMYLTDSVEIKLNVSLLLPMRHMHVHVMGMT